MIAQMQQYPEWQRTIRAAQAAAKAAEEARKEAIRIENEKQAIETGKNLVKVLKLLGIEATADLGVVTLGEFEFNLDRFAVSDDWSHILFSLSICHKRLWDIDEDRAFRAINVPDWVNVDQDWSSHQAFIARYIDDLERQYTVSSALQKVYEDRIDPPAVYHWLDRLVARIAEGATDPQDQVIISLAEYFMAINGDEDDE